MAKAASKNFFVWMLVISIVSWSIFETALIFVIPVFAGMFADFGAKLPGPTQWIIDLSNCYKRHTFLFSMPVLGLIVLIAIGQRPKPRFAQAIMPLVLLAMLAATTAAMFLPVFKLGDVAGGMSH